MSWRHLEGQISGAGARENGYARQNGYARTRPRFMLGCRLPLSPEQTRSVRADSERCLVAATLRQGTAGRVWLRDERSQRGG
jgi:hypothetical protein